MCMPTPSNVSGFGYSWGFTSSADLTKGEVETPSSMSYTLGNTVSPETTLTVMSHKSPQVQEKVGTVVAVSNTAAQVTRVVTANAPAGRRAMFVLNESPTHTINRVSQQNQTATIHNNILVTAANLTSKPFMTPIGPIQLTAEECNEILMKRALQAQGIATPVIDASQLNHTLLNGGIKTINEGTQQTQTETIQTTPVHHHILHTKQEPGTANNSPKTVYSQTELMNTNTVMTTVAPAAVKERPYSCDECGKSFLLKHHLTTHARVHTGERPHVCAHCGKAFARKHCLNTHLLLHSADRPYRCHECKMAFTLKHHLVTHSRVHSRDRPFVCGECGRGFPLKRHLVTHSKYHAGERPYVCSDCGESFAQKEHLVMHSRFHGSLSPFVCAECGAAFARKFQLVNHGRVHGKVPHACPVCAKEFLQKRTLVAHLK
ncbi:zinc finger protein 81-like [Ostrinia nubilalis]|uniref:zinc finger protein 81-like n=1 Tax=Ostrinia nubilalis TaxID=29057 RepID=UPI0030822322